MNFQMYDEQTGSEAMASGHREKPWDGRRREKGPAFTTTAYHRSPNYITYGKLIHNTPLPSMAQPTSQPVPDA
jgi:hypothetical protein